MRLVDTSAWIEWLIGSPTGVAVAARIPSPDEWLVPTIVQLELIKWLARERGDDTADRVLAFTQTCNVAALNTKTAVLAAEFCRQHRLATADAIIYATAQSHGVDLLTCEPTSRGWRTWSSSGSRLQAREPAAPGWPPALRASRRRRAGS